MPGLGLQVTEMAVGTPVVETAMSKDGTSIGWVRTGDGPPLVLVHGTTADRTRWKPVLPALEDRFTVYAVDRRGPRRRFLRSNEATYR